MRSLTKAEAGQLYASLGRLMRLSDEAEVWPGHAVAGRAGSTIGEERHGNPFLEQASFDAFYRLR
jgi:glyoxylase-like metal-dependent hydrolase (beta-lactamase superfamily II)